ncbi:hypothetical protein V8C42DRAFT_356982 [Trichoderma barbatum]
MSSVSTRRAPLSQGGLARLVSKFENLGASSNSPQDIAAATHETRDHPTLTSRFQDAPSVQEKERDNAVRESRTATSPSLAPIRASLVTYSQLETPVRKTHVGKTATPSPKVGKLILRRGLAVADMRRLFERGLDESAASNVVQTATYDPKRAASPTITKEDNDNKTFSLAGSPMKGSSFITEAGILAKPDLHEERDIVSDLVSIHCHVEHPEYLPRPLASPDRSSQHPGESRIAIKDSKSTSTWQRNEPRFKLQGGVFLHKTPSPLKNMVVTEIGTWHPKPCGALEVVSVSENRNLRSDEQGLASLKSGKRDDLELLENLQPEPRESRSPLLPTSKSVPFQQSKVSNLRRKFDGAFSSTAATKSKVASDKQQEQATARAWDAPPPPRLLSPVENGPPRSYNRSPGMDSVSSQASDIKPLLYTKPSLIKASRHRKKIGEMIRSDWRRKAKSSSEDGEQRNFPVQRKGYNVDGEGGAAFEQKYQEIPCEETWTDGSEISSTKQKPIIADRHPSLHLLRRRLMSRSHGLFVSQAHCMLEQPQPVRGKELRRLTSLCRERMAAMRARALTE